MSQLFASGGQTVGASALELVLPKNIQGWFPLGLTGLISLQSRDSQVYSPVPQFKSIDSLALSLLYGPTLISIYNYWINHSSDYMLTICWLLSAKWCLLLFNMLSRFVIAFLPRSKHLLISWLQSPSTVIVEHRIIKSVTASTFSPSIWHEVMGSDATNFIFWMLSFKPTS